MRRIAGFLVPILLVAALTASAGVAHADENAVRVEKSATWRPLRFGLKAGFAASSIRGPDSEFSDYSARFAPAAAMFANIRIAPRVSVQPELGINQKGADLDVDFYGTLYEGTIKLSYVELSLLGHLVFTDAGAPARVYVLGGPSVARLFSATARRSKSNSHEDLMDETNKTDTSLVLGIGLETMPGNGKVGYTLEARYQHGLSNLDDDGSSSMHTSSVLVMAGMSF